MQIFRTFLTGRCPALSAGSYRLLILCCGLFNDTLRYQIPLYQSFPPLLAWLAGESAGLTFIATCAPLCSLQAWENTYNVTAAQGGRPAYRSSPMLISVPLRSMVNITLRPEPAFKAL
jgi:hypothetical protein